MMIRSRSLSASGFVSFLGVIALVGCQPAIQLPEPPTPTVTVSRPIQRTETDFEIFTGRTDAVKSVDIRARVSGYLMEVKFKDGDVVKEGDLLYQIDQRPFDASLDQAKGQVERLNAQKKLLDIQVDRYRKLAEKGAGSQQDYDQYLAQQAEVVGSIKAAEAQVKQADLNVGFTKVTSPITGKISRTLLTEGNLIIADNTLLTTVMSIDPMYAYFNIEEPTLLKIRKLVRDGSLGSHKITDVKVQMGAADDIQRKFPLSGSLDFMNNTVDAQTGTILFRGVFANPYKLDRPAELTPGLFVRVRMPIGIPHPVMLITERAVGTDQGKKYVYIVGGDDAVARRDVKLGQMFDGLQAVEEGIQAGDRIIVNGLQRVRPKSKVKVEEVEMSTLAGVPDAVRTERKSPAATEPAGKTTPTAAPTGTSQPSAPQGASKSPAQQDTLQPSVPQ